MTARPQETAVEATAARAAGGGAPRVVDIAATAAELGLSSLWQYRELVYFLVWRNLKVRYKQSALGAAYAIVQPVFAVAVFTVVFGRFARIPSDDVSYAPFVFAAIVPWTYFAEALRGASSGLVDDADLVRKVYFPRLVIPLAMVVAPAFDFLLSFVVLLALLAVYGLAPGWQVLLVPVFLLQAMLLALSVALWLGPINVRFRDIKHTLPFLIQIWMYASPVVFPVSLVPERWRFAYALNPMVGVIEGFRWAVLGKASPDFRAMAVGAALMLVVLVTGVFHFRRTERSFADVI
jgi:lipopolysaccharide transport system permease protein